MIRYFRLYLYFLRFSFSRAFEFRMDFYFRIFMDTVFYSINIIFYKIIFLHTRVLGGWDEPQMMIFVAGFLFLDAVNMTVIANNMWYLPLYINKGDLDYYLTRPVSSLFFLSLRDFAANSFLNLIMTIGILYWAFKIYPQDVSIIQGAAYIFFLLIGVVLYYSIRMIMIIPVFWMHSGRGLENIFWGLTRFMERPDGIFKGYFRRVITIFLPFSVMASFPARIFFDITDWPVIVHFLSVTAVFFLILLVFWKIGLRAYSSASS